MKIGGECHIVVELSSVVIFELEVYPEPKILSRSELNRLIRTHGTTVAVAKIIGGSQQFVSGRTKRV
jgi:hypothetical protein